MFDYFQYVVNKYLCRLSLNKPVVIRLDGKNVCSNLKIEMLDESNGGFAFAIKNTAKYLSKKYNCIVYVANDELNLIIENPLILETHFKKLEVQKISSLIAQEIFLEFNNHYRGDYIFFDARTFNIPSDKVISYQKHRLSTAKNVLVKYFIKKKRSFSTIQGVPLIELETELNKSSEVFRNRTSYQKEGITYNRGNVLGQGSIYDETIEDDNLI